jgi:hypothetical protein
MIVPAIGPAGVIFAYVAFVAFGMGVGWIVALIWLRATRHGSHQARRKTRTGKTFFD